MDSKAKVRSPSCLLEGEVNGLLRKVEGRKLPKPLQCQEPGELSVGTTSMGNTNRNTAAM